MHVSIDNLSQVNQMYFSNYIKFSRLFLFMKLPAGKLELVNGDQMVICVGSVYKVCFEINETNLLKKKVDNSSWISADIWKHLNHTWISKLIFCLVSLDFNNCLSESQNEKVIQKISSFFFLFFVTVP